MLIFQSLLQILSKIPILKQIIQAVGSQQQVYSISGMYCHFSYPLVRNY